MRYFILKVVKREGIDLNTALLERKNVNELNERTSIPNTTELLNDFISQNIELIMQVATINPTLSPQDEWRTDDYSEYEN